MHICTYNFYTHNMITILAQTQYRIAASTCIHTYQPPNTNDISCPSHLPTSIYSAHDKSSITAYKPFHVQPEDGHCKAPKHVVVHIMYIGQCIIVMVEE